MTRSEYPEDEFDTLGADRVPQGVHRAPIPRWRQLLPFLLVLVLAPALAFVAVQALSGSGDDGADAPTTSQEGSSGATEEPTDAGEPTEEPTAEEPTAEEPTTEESADAPTDLDYGVSVVVLNGAGVAGLATDTATRVDELGFTQTTAGDYTSGAPAVTTIYYDNADQADEAQAIADDLGITALTESADASDGAIVLVLRSDFTQG